LIIEESGLASVNVVLFDRADGLRRSHLHMGNNCMTKIFAHRGYRAKYPENTMLAFKKAIETGCYGIELDVQLSKDGAVVIIHDENVKRTTNSSGAVCDLTIAQLRELDAGHGERIPLLSEYLDLVVELPLITNIELKNSVIPYDGMEKRVLEMVRSHGLSERIIFSSFNHASVNKMKKLAPDIFCGYICSGKLDGESLAASMRETGVEFIHPHIKSLDGEFMEAVRKNNIDINIFTVNDVGVAKRLISQGVYGIFTDDPHLLADEALK